ncbi:MAG: hypothetical protein R3E87_13290 [Burkholderiaceae bacterium]
MTLAMTGVIAAVGAGLIGLGMLQFQREAERRDEIMTAARASQASLRRLEANLDTMSEKYPAFDSLKARGIIGDLPKTMTLDRFESLLARSGVPLLNYSLGGRLPVDLNGISGFNLYDPGQHEMRFETSPLHEERLIHLTDELDRSLGGLHSFEGCTLTRNDSRGIEQAMTQRVPRLSARCTINWFVFAQRNSEQGAATATMGN